MPASNPDARNVGYPRLFVASSNIHGLGLFAGEEIEWGRRLIEYQGQLLSAKEVKRRQRFYDSIGFTCLMQFGDGRGVDGITGCNESRFINHSAQPNIGALREDDWRIVFYSLEDIAKGEELTFNYGFDPKELRHENQTVADVRDDPSKGLQVSPTRIFVRRATPDS